jgi:sugar O-acyltransferase (sialic acid O-acetyltransferase NeuD family)
MLVVGARGMAIELLEILSTERNLSNESIVLYDDVNKPKGLFFDRFKVLTTPEMAEAHFQNEDKNFVLGLGNPVLRRQMAEKFISLGGKLNTLISDKALVGSFNTIIEEGCLLMQGVIITNNVQLDKGVLVNLNSTISHDCQIGAFTEIACNVSIPGRCRIGKGVFIGSNATLNPDISIGDYAVIGAGAVVINDVPPSTKVVGNPAKIIS